VNELLLGLFLFVVILGFIAVLGHGLWVLIAWISRRAFGMPEPAATPRRQASPGVEKCPGCWRPVSSRLRTCPECGLDRKNPVAFVLHDLQVTENQLNFLVKRGALSETAFEQARQALDARRLQLLGKVTPLRTPARSEEILEVLPADTGVGAAHTPRVTPQPAAAAVTVSPRPVVETKQDAAPIAAAESRKTPPPRRSMGELFAGFMEERNILWGELVGGLLMVGCSIALVISLWTKLEAIPYFPFFIFSGITAALFGAGLYTLHHWKLESTSRGLLVIATLLVPLNFLVMAGLSKGRSADWIEWVTEAGALIVFTELVRRAARVLAPETGWRLTAALIGTAVCPLLTPRLLERGEPEPWRFFLLGCLPVACQVVCTVPSLFRRAPRTDREAFGLFGFLGMTFFALAAALGFVVHWGGDIALSLHHLAVPFAVAGLPILAAGLMAARGERESSALSALAVMIGTGVALGGVTILLVAVLLAWPQPLGLLVSCSLGFAVLSWAAYRYRLPLVHLAALPCLALGYVTGLHLTRGSVTLLDGAGLASALQSSVTGIALGPFALLLAGFGEFLAVTHRRVDRVYHVVVAGVAALASLALVTLTADAEPAAAAILSTVYAVTTLTLNTRWRQNAAGYVGFALIVAATLWMLHWHLPGREHVALWGFVLSLEAVLLAGCGLIVSTSTARALKGLASLHVWRDMAAVAGLLGLLLSLWTPTLPQADWLTATAAVLAITAVALAWIYRQPMLTWIGCTALAAASVHAVFWTVADWHVPRPWLFAIIVPATLLVIAAVSLRRFGRGAQANCERILVQPLRFASAVLCCACVPLLLICEQGQFTVLALFAGVLAGLWFVQAWLERSRAVFAIFQATLWWAAGYGVTAWLEGQEWVRDAYPAGLADLRSVHAYLAGLSLVCAVGVLTTRILRRTGITLPFGADDRQPSVNEGLLGVLLLAQLLLSVVAGALLPDTPWAQHTGSWLGWLALFFVAAAAVVALARRAPTLQQQALFAVALTGLGLLAGNIEVSQSGWGTRLLLLGWGLSSPVTALVCWTRGRSRQGEHIAWQYVAQTWVNAAAAITLLLATQSAFLRNEQSWAAGAVAAAGLGMAVLALWQRREMWAFGVGAAANLSVALVIWRFRNLLPVNDWWITLVQATTITSATAALLWLALRTRLYEIRLNSAQDSPFLAVQIGLGLLGNAVVLGLPFGLLLNRPGDPLPHEVLAVGNLPGWLALVLALGAALWFAELVSPAARIHLLGAFGIGMGVWAACALDPWDNQSQWLAYHVLTGVWALTAFAAAFVPTEMESLPSAALSTAFRRRLGRLMADQLRPLQGWTLGVGIVVCALSLRGLEDDPLRSWWPAAVIVAISVILAASALRFRAPLFVYVAGLLAGVAGCTLWYVHGSHKVTSFAATLVLSLSCAAGMWSAAEWLVAQRRPDWDQRKNWLPFSHAALTLSLVLLALLVVGAIVSSAGGGTLQVASPLTWSAVGATALAILLGAWDQQATFSRGSLYGLGLGVVLLTLHAQNWPPDLAGRTAAPALATYVLLINIVVAAGSRLGAVRQLLPQEKSVAWFGVAQAAIASIAAVLSVWISIRAPTPTDRLVGPLTVALLIPAGVLLTKLAGRETAILRYATLALGVLLVAETGWALLDANDPAIWLHRNIWLMLALAVQTVVYGVGLARLLPAQVGWWQAGRRMGPVLGALATLVLLVVLGQEGISFDRHLNRTPLAPAAVAIIAAALAVLIGAALTFALTPGRDPLGLSEPGRMLYVYAAEALLALTFLHFRLTVPELFHGWLVQYWTLIVMGLAFLGVGLGELCHRKGLRVLARPLHQTGIFLPLLPLLAFWLRPPDAWREALSAQLPGLTPMLNDVIGGAALSTFQKYAVLWFVAGMLYAAVAMTRRSYRFAFAAALAANFGLWAFFWHHEWTYLVHPQVWLIPLALIVLAAEHINRERLVPAQSAAIRYLALCMIYVSSTADMFIAGLGNSVMLPLVLAVLAVLGVLAGMSLRVRAFLFLGVAFLFVDIFSMIWHAAVDQYQTWVWWASGIVLGAAIIALFALFEKRRNDVLQMVQQLKQWR
jgi:hypothetical protein